MAASGAKSGLPSEYQQVEWIGRSSNQFIVTSFKPETPNFTIKVKYFKPTQASSEQALIIGKPAGQSSAGYEIGFTNKANRIFAFSASSAEIINPIVYNNINEASIKFSTATPTIEITLKNGQTVLTGVKTGSNQSWIGDGVMSLFANENGALGCPARIYELSVINSNGGLLYNGIPCYEKATGTAGIYDTVSSIFNSSYSTANMDKGPDVN